MKICDTSVLVDIDRGGVEDKVERLDAEGRHAISAVTVTELRFGVNAVSPPGAEDRNAAVTGLNRLLARLDIRPVSRPIAATAADILAEVREEGTPIDDLHDLYIGATARHDERAVLTDNVGHFERMRGVDVVDWRTF